MHRQEMEERVAKLNEKISQLKESGILENLVQPHTVRRGEEFITRWLWKITETTEKDCLMLTTEGECAFMVIEKNDAKQWFGLEDIVSAEVAALDLFPREDLVEKINLGLEEEIIKHTDAIKTLARVLMNQ